jgi:hypothetical protein
VVLDGFTPVAFAGAVAVVVVVATGVVTAAVGVVVGVVSAAGGGESFFSCPGAFAEFPGASPWLPLPLPFPFPAYAAPANTRTLRTSTHVLVSRMVILPLPRISR